MSSGTAPGLPRQTSLQTPVISNISAPSDRPPEYLYPELPPISSPPPPYEVAMRKVSTIYIISGDTQVNHSKRADYSAKSFLPLVLPLAFSVF
jgi:hypothetical protein